MVLSIGDSEVLIVPAPFMHSAGNLQVYDPLSKILYTGDLGASLGIEYDKVEDFDAHIGSMVGFHQRYMPSSAVLKHWVKMIESLEIDQIVPQHGAIFPNRDMSMRFIEWIDNLSCGLDIMGADAYRIPDRS
jgi:flavorubredoxin